MGAPMTRHAAARAARRNATVKLVADTYLPSRIIVTCRVYDDATRQYRTMPVSYVVPVRDTAEFMRLWGLITRVVESDAWTNLEPVRRRPLSRKTTSPPATE